MFGIGGSRPNGFMLTQWPCVLAQWLPVALSTGQITPQSAVHCCLSICMLFSCLVTWLFQSATSYVISSQSDQSFWSFKRSDVDPVIIQKFDIYISIFSFWCGSFPCLYFLLMRCLIGFTNELFQKWLSRNEVFKTNY